jgi:hypothetical protein
MEWPNERNVWAFTRFRVAHFERPWAAVGVPVSRDPWFNSQYYAIGRAAFAPFVDSQDVYLETNWAGLWGKGRRLTLTPEGLIERSQDLWIS